MANTVETVAPDVILRTLIDRSITDFRDDSITSIGENKFRGCNSLNNIFAPNASSGTYSLSSSSLVTAVIGYTPSGTSSNFSNSGSLKAVDYVHHDEHTSDSRINSTAFSACSSLKVIVLRGANRITLANTNAFANTPFVSGGSGGTIYIPKSLYDHLGDGSSSDYKAASNWSTVDGYGTITWAQIEGSMYEYMYVDGTPISTQPTLSVTYTAPQYIDFYTDMSIDYLKNYLTVTVTFGSSAFTLLDYQYALEGEFTVGTSTITVKGALKTTTFTVTGVLVAPGLPEGYTHLRSIGKWANAAYLATGIQERVGGFYAEYVIRPNANGSSNNMIFTTSTGNVYYPKVTITNGTAYLEARCGGGAVSSAEFPNYSLGSVYKITADFYNTGVVTLNGNTIYTVQRGSSWSTLDRPYYIFNTSGQTSFIGNIYSLKLYQGDTIYRNYIPCKNASGTVGMYDLETETFYSNAGSGSIYAD